MSILLAILKVIGIILLILLGIVFVLLVLVLFVPVRYQLKLQVDKDVYIKGSFSYLLGFIYLGFGYSENKENGKLRIMGIPVYDLFPSEEQKQKKENKEKRKQEKNRRKIKNQKKKKQEEQHTTYVEKKENHRRDVPTSVECGEHQSKSDKNDTDEQKKTLQNIKNYFIKVRCFFQKVVDKVKNLKYTIIDFYSKMCRRKDTFLWYVEVFNRDESRRAIRRAKFQLGQLWKHVKPSEFKGFLQFGFDDPGTTGDVFSKICMIYPLYSNNIIIIPDFEKTMFKCEVFMKGRIRFVNLIYVGWKIMFDEDIRNLYKILKNNKG